MMTLWFKFKGYIIAAGTFLLAMLGVYLKGRSDANQKTKEKAKEVQIKAHEANEAGEKKIKEVQNEKIDTTRRDHFSK